VFGLGCVLGSGFSALDRFFAWRFEGEDVFLGEAALPYHSAAVFEVSYVFGDVVCPEGEFRAGFFRLFYECGAGDAIAGVDFDGDVVFDGGGDYLFHTFFGPERIVFVGYGGGQEGGICEDVDRLVGQHGDDSIDVHIHEVLLVFGCAPSVWETGVRVFLVYWSFTTQGTSWSAPGMSMRGRRSNILRSGSKVFRMAW